MRASNVHAGRWAWIIVIAAMAGLVSLAASCSRTTARTAEADVPQGAVLVAEATSPDGTKVVVRKAGPMVVAGKQGDNGDNICTYVTDVDAKGNNRATITTCEGGEPVTTLSKMFGSVVGTSDCDDATEVKVGKPGATYSETVSVRDNTFIIPRESILSAEKKLEVVCVPPNGTSKDPVEVNVSGA